MFEIILFSQWFICWILIYLMINGYSRIESNFCNGFDLEQSDKAFIFGISCFFSLISIIGVIVVFFTTEKAKGGFKF